MADSVVRKREGNGLVTQVVGARTGGRPGWLRVLAVASGLGLGLGAGSLVAARDPTPSLRVVSADASGVEVELVLPAPRVASPDVGVNCGQIALAALPGHAAPAPGATAYGWLVAVPEPGGASVMPLAVTEATWEPGSPVCSGGDEAPIAGAAVGRTLAAVTGDTIAPPAPPEALPEQAAPVAELVALGDLRGQAVARLVVRPVARGPHGRLVRRSRLRLRIAYRDPATIVAAEGETGPFADLRSMLLNWRFPPHRAGGASGKAASPASVGSLLSGSPWLAPADPQALKVVVTRDGPVVVTGADLARAGWDLAALDPSALGLAVAGAAIPFELDGLAEGHVTVASRLVFAGRAMTGPYTRENVYWLQQESPGPTLAERAAAPGAGTAAPAFTATLPFEQDTRWLASMDPRDGDDRWMWGDPLNAADKAHRALTVTLTVSNLAPDPAPARLRVRLQGYTSDATVTPDHHVRFLLNDRVLGQSRFDGMGAHELDLTVPAGLLTDGDNRLALQAVADTGAVVDQVYLNRVTLELAAGYRAVADRLEFAAPSASPFTQAFTLSGFTSPDVTVLDITDADRPIRLTGVRAEPAEDGTFSIRLQDTVAAGRRYLAFAAAGARSPVRLLPNVASSLRSDRQGADYIVITHPDFAVALQPLVERRRAQGLRTAVVRIDDIYDEFSFGVFDPRAIKSFLQQAADHWLRPAPSYLLLVGESNLDYRRGYNSGPLNFVPSITLDTALAANELTAYTSDLWFATLGTKDLVPDLMVGRFSVSTAEQARTVVAKTLRYEDQPISAAWRHRAVLVADDTDAVPMEQLSEALATRLPADTETSRFYAARYQTTRHISTDIGAALDSGALVLNFAGHANVALWSPAPGGGYIFDNGHIAALTNGDAMPLFTAATCMNGWIDHPFKPVAMSELWLTHPGGGGVVAWAPSGFSTVAVQERLFPPVYDGLFDGRARSIGALVTAAETGVLAQNPGWYDYVGMYILQGDPALVVSGVPALPTPTPTPTDPAGLYLPYAVQHQP
jgi:hypothetical protein